MQNNAEKFNVAVVGAQGYSGLVLSRLLLNHPHANLLAVFSRDTQWCLADDLPEAAAAEVPCYTLDALADVAAQCQTVFLATPADVSMDLALSLIDKTCQIIDLSGAFRLDKQNFEQWYQQPHQAAALLPTAYYGLVPWWSADDITSHTTLVANPGCYPTAALMALLPLLTQNLISANDIIIDAKSGLSGAGRSAKKSLLFCEMAQEFYPYKVGQHQHTPEIAGYLQHYSGQDVALHFTTQLLPVKRGISMSIYADIAPLLLDQSADAITAKIDAAYDAAYADYPLVKYGALNNVSAAESLNLTALSKVVGSSRVHIGYQLLGNKLVVFSAIDNLLKGAASQAVENFNQLNALPLITGLLDQEGLL